MGGVQNRGFTALELMVTMAMVAILLTVAVPSFKHYSWNLRMRTAMDSLQTDLNLARRNAINLNILTVSCPAPDADICSAVPDWQYGWIVFTDLNGDRQRQAGEPLLKRTGAVEFMRISSSQSRASARFNPNGSAAGSNMTIRFCDDRGARYAGKISISNSGRIQLQSGGIEATENCP